VETKTENGSRNGRELRRDDGDVCNNGETVQKHSKPTRILTVRDSRNSTVEHDVAPANRRQSSGDVTRSMSDGERGGRWASQQADSRRHRSADDQLTRVSRNEAEQRVENEIIEALKRDAELRLVHSFAL